MAKQTVITHNTYSFFKPGPSIRDMYNIVMCLKDYSKDIRITEACVLSTTNIYFGDPAFRYYRDESQLESYFRNSEPNYTPAGRNEIKKILSDAKELGESTKQGIHPHVAEIEHLIGKENTGSYVRFEDLSGSIKGKVEYVGSDGKIIAGVLEQILGAGVSLPLVVSGFCLYSDSFGKNAPSTTAYALLGSGALLFTASAIDSTRRIIKSAFNKHIKTTIWPAANTDDANRKARSLAELVRKEC